MKALNALLVIAAFTSTAAFAEANSTCSARAGYTGRDKKAAKVASLTATGEKKTVVPKGLPAATH